jgi:RND family efflux transporter MFP subunit
MKKILTTIIAVAIIGGAYIAYAQFNGSDNKDGDTKETAKVVKTIKIGEASEDGVITRQGVIKGQTEVYLSAKAEGRVQKMYKEIGERVYKGQLLAYVDGREYWAQSNVAKTGVNFSDKVVSKTKKFFDEQIHQAKKGRDLAKDAYKNAKKSGDAEAIGKAKASYEMAKKSVEVAKDGYKLQVEVAKGQRDVAQSQLNAANTVAGNTRLTAPFAGVIAQTKVEVGDLVGPERPMFLLIDDSVKEVEVSVEGYYLKGLKVGDKIAVVAKNGEKREAKIKAVSPMIDTHTRKGIIKITLPEDEIFGIGEYVDVLIPQVETSIAEEIIIPQNSVVKVYHDTFVFITEEGKAKKKKVELGDIIGEGVIVKNGLDKNSEIIIEGQQYLRDGEAITSQK